MSDRILLAFVVGAILGAAVSSLRMQQHWESIALRYGIAERDLDTGELYLVARPPGRPEYSTQFAPIPVAPEYQISYFNERELNVEDRAYAGRAVRSGAD